jgi:hypothetical protein
VEEVMMPESPSVRVEIRRNLLAKALRFGVGQTLTQIA